jgi:steroid 5-alpha reductase family enzyme
MSGPGQVLPVAAASVLVLMLASWALSLRLRDVSIIDPLWGPAFVVVALVAALVGEGCRGRRWLLLGLTALWGLRLGGHLVRRKLAERGEDRRYARMRERHAAGFALWSLWAIFGVQGLLVLIVSLPLQVAAQRGGQLTWTVAPGLLLYALGLAFEAIGDEQLRRFKSRPNSGGQVMDRGLWRYTRHPNYFGDACVWWGVWLVAAAAWPGVLTIVSPIVMTYFLVFATGARLLEQRMRQRPGWEEYAARTSMFLPLPPRR